jgi:hypothetical protein
MFWNPACWWFHRVETCSLINYFIKLCLMVTCLFLISEYNTTGCIISKYIFSIPGHNHRAIPICNCKSISPFPALQWLNRKKSVNELCGWSLHTQSALYRYYLLVNGKTIPWWEWSMQRKPWQYKICNCPDTSLWLIYCELQTHFPLFTFIQTITHMQKDSTANLHSDKIKKCIFICKVTKTKRHPS